MSGWAPPPPPADDEARRRRDRPSFLPAHGGTPAEPVPPPPAGAAQTCYRHADREAHIRCQRCDRPICPDCMNPAPVGFQCPDCVREGRSIQRPLRGSLGGRAGAAAPVVTYGLIAVNVVLFVLQQVRPEVTQALFQVTGPVYFDDGHLGGIALHDYWRILTAGFVHGGVLHIAVNMFSLYSVGIPLERAVGRLRFALVYFLSLFGSGLLVLLFTAPNVPTLGASGAVFGVFGAVVALAKKMGSDIKFALGVLAVNVVINVVYASALSWQGHLGGLVTGALAGVMLGWMPGRGTARRRHQLLGLAALAVVIVVGLVVACLRVAV